MSKYIVKGCPRIESYTNNCWDSELPDEIPCKDRTDCKIKQIVKLCKAEVHQVIIRSGNASLCKRNPLAEKILQLLEVEEVK